MSDLSTQIATILDENKVPTRGGSKLMGELMGVVLDYNKETVATLRALVADLTDDEKCEYDHHGYCQTHGWMESEVECPHKRAKRLGIFPS